MAVHTSEASLKIVHALFAAKYENGLRLLDRMGETILRLQTKDPTLILKAHGERLATFVNVARTIVLNVTVEQVDATLSQKKLAWGEAEKAVEDMAILAERAYETAVAAIEAPNTQRVGARFIFLAPADSLEDSDRFLAKAAGSPLLKALTSAAKGDLEDSQTGCVVVDSENGYRRKITVMSAVIDQSHDAPYFGFPGSKATGGVVVDVDSYARPESGHFAKVGFFIQSSFLRAKTIARETFGWLLEQQK